MRTFEEIFKDYSVFVVEKTKDTNMSYDNLIQIKGTKAAHAFYYKSLLELLYDRNNGLYYFCKFVLGDLIHCGFPSQFRMNRLIRQWDKLIKSHKKLCILAARGHSKSLFFSEILNIYDMFLFKHKRVLIISSTQEQANRIISEIKTLIGNNEWLQDKKTNDRWAAETIGFNGGYILARGVGSEIRGEHVDRIVCVPGWTLIDTNNGCKRIDKIKVGDVVRTHTGRFKKVKKLYHRYSTGNIREIKTTNHRLLITNNHPLLTQYGWLPAKYIRKGDIVEWNEERKDYQIITFDNKKITNRKHIQDILLDEEVAHFLGLFAAEGCCRNGNTIALTFNNKETKYQEECINILNKLGVKSYIDKHNSWATTVIGYSITLHNKFKEMFNKGAKNKKIPIEIFNSPASVKASFLLGLLEGDGTKANGGKSYTLGSTSKQLINDSIRLAKTLSITPTKYIKRSFKNKISIYNTTTTVYTTHFKTPYINKLKALSLSNKFEVLSNNKVRNTTGHLYNIEVEEDNSYVAGGITVHNCDDILRSDNKLTDQEVEDYLDMTLMPMILARDGQMVLVGTPFNSNDIFATIMNRIREGSNWKLDRFPAILNYDTKTLQCPDRFTWDDIMEKRLSMGALKFAREYQLEFFSRDISLFPRKIVEPALNKGKELTFLKKWTNLGIEWSIVCGVDVARAGTVSADYTVVIVLAFNNITQEKRIIHMWRSKGLKIREQAEEIASISRVFSHPFFLVEKNNVGQELIDEMVDKYNLNVKEFLTGGKGQKKDELIRSLVMAFEHEQIVIPRGDEEAIKVTNNLLDELERFCAVPTAAGNEQFKGVGTHDDAIMALAIANRATLEFGVPFAAGGGGTHTYGEYDAYIKNSNSTLSDLEILIKLGIIK